MRRPDITGTHGRGFQVPLDRLAGFAALHPDKVDPVQLLTTVDMWYVNGKEFHPFWQWWLVALLDLQQIVGQPAPKLHYPGAQYELIIVTLDAAHKEPPVNGEGPFFVSKNAQPFSLQFHGIERKQAQAVCRFVVEAVCAGRTSPDNDWARQNRHAINKLVNDYYVGRYGGPARSHPLEIDPYRNTFTGLVDDTVEAWG